jgi:superfamily II DNA or RNA helicase
MVRLEEIVPGSRVRGIASGDFVEILAARSFGPDAVEVTYKGNGTVDQTVLYRSSEAELELASPTRRFAFDGDGHLLRLASEALRIRLAHLFDPFVAVRSSQIEALPHQLTAVYGEMLPRQPLRFLLADDPGAGKTIMAGLFIKELLIRGDLERCLIVAPGSLVEQWQDELSEKFGLLFDILTRDQVEAAATGNFFAEHQRVIARLDMLARADDLRQRLEAAPVWDLIICDEAHRMSASFFGGEVKYTKRYQLGQTLGSLARHFLLMSATPHNGKEEDFQLFMGLLDSDRFEGRFREGAHKVDVSDMMRRLVKEELRRFDGTPLFPERKAYTVSYKLSKQESVLYEAVTRYVREEMNRADQIQDGGERRRNTVGFALQILQRRLASSPAAIHESLKRRLGRLEARLEEEKLLKRGRDASEALIQTVVLPTWDDEDLEEAPEDEVEGLEDEVVDQATAARTIAELEAEIVSLKELETLARTLRRSGEDTKWCELDRILDDPIVHDPANDVRRKIVIFTESRDTLEYLAGRIRGRTGEDESVVTIHGGVPRDRRRAAIAAFNDDPAVRFLVANDAAGEGVNLQRGSHLMVNYDLPWNPNRLEQRFGRIHRIGQTEVCHLWNLIAGETREGQVYARLLEKLEAARETLGGKVYDVLGELFEARALRDMFMEAIRYGERPDVRDRLFTAIDGAVDRKRIEELVARSKLTKEGLDASTITALREEMERAEARRLQPRYIQSFFEEAFALTGGVMYEREKGRFEVRRVPAILRDRDRLIGRGDPVLPRYERICFDKPNIPGKHQAALVAPGHPLLDSVIDLTLERYRTLLGQGAILIDENDGTEPRVLIYLEHSIKDGRVGRAGRPRVISQRLQFVYLDRYGKAVDGGAAPYLDCRPATGQEQGLVETLLHDGWLTGAIEDQARAYAISDLVPRHLEEVKARRIDEIERTEVAVKERLRREILHWQHRALELEREEKAGKQQRLNSQNARRYVEILTDRLEKRLTELSRERAIAPLPPEVQGAALIIPMGWLQKNGAASSKPAGFAQDRGPIELIAMSAVMTAERALGRDPKDVSAENRGYDIESRDPNGGRLHFIEVKGRHEAADTVSITRNEMLTAFNTEERYVLAVVRVEAGFAQQPVYVRNPIPLFGPEPGFAEVSRVINLKKLVNAGEAPS